MATGNPTAIGRSDANPISMSMTEVKSLQPNQVPIP